MNTEIIEVQTGLKQADGGAQQTGENKLSPAGDSLPIPVEKIPLEVITEGEMAQRLTDEYLAVEGAKNVLLKQTVRFGAELIKWEQFLGRSGGGRGHGGEGLKGWMEKHCPHINYGTATKYKTMAARVMKMVGNGEMALAALRDEETVTRPDGHVTAIDAQVIERRDKIYTEATSRRKLEQLWLSFERERLGDETAAIRAANAAAPYTRKTPEECAVVTVYSAIKPILTHRGAILAAYAALPADKLAEARDTFREQVRAIEDELKRRG